MRIGQSSSCTNAGRKRLQNEDRFVEQPPIFAIADGMGGAQAGEVAAALAASALTESPADGGGETRVIALIQEANRRVHERASTDAATSGMGTTMTVALVGDEGKVTIGHVGDSRAYLFRDDRLEQLTDDHSLVAELVRRGELSPQEAEIHPQRSVITRALGTDPDVDVDAFSIAAQPGDVYLICSDGLSDMVGAEDIEEIVRRYRDDLKQAAKALIQAANRAGGDDNITAVVFDIVDGEPAAAEPDEVTREQVLADQTAARKDFDEEDTLHPEDAVTPPPPAPNAVDTMVVPAEEIATREAEAAETEAQATPPVHVSFGRRLLALLVIVALAALIVVLVVWGLAR
jgi:protein phosphatase